MDLITALGAKGIAELDYGAAVCTVHKIALPEFNSFFSPFIFVFNVAVVFCQPMMR
jgi:hypothetical protein